MKTRCFYDVSKASIRRFLWHHCYDLHYLIYKEKFNEEEYQELIERIKKGKTDSSNNNQ